MLFYPMAVAVCTLAGVGDTVLLDFQADWCGPCRSMQPTVQRLEAAGYPVRQVNIDQEPDLARQYNVSSIPCFVAVVDGRERGRQVGASSYEQLKQMMSSAGVQPGQAGNQTPGGRAQGLGVRGQGSGGNGEPMIARGQSPSGGLMGRMGLGRRAAPAPPGAPLGMSGPGAMAGPGGPTSPPVIEMPSQPSAPPMPGGAPAAGGGMAPASFNAAPSSFGAAQPPAMQQPPSDFAAAPPAAKSGFVPLSAALAAVSAAPNGPMVMPASFSAPVANTNGASANNAGGMVAATDGPLETRLLKASVRIRVEGTNDVALASGTIIDQRQDPNGQGGEALVLTCAHVFRDSQGRAPIRIERFDQQIPQAAVGRLLRYDLDRDVALVTFRVETPATVARLAPLGSQAKQTDPVISIGCDNGQPPTARRSNVIAINKIQGAPNLQVAGQPAVGRSGGGLFDVQGRLIGVCNFADPQDHAGLYADVISGHQLLAQVGLAEISKAASLAGDHMGQPAQPPAMPDSMPRGMGAAGTDMAASSMPGAVATELICVVRTGSGTASRNETIIISNASPDLVNRLVAEQRGGAAAFPTSLDVPREQPAPQPTANNWRPDWK